MTSTIETTETYYSKLYKDFLSKIKKENTGLGDVSLIKKKLVYIKQLQSEVIGKEYSETQNNQELLNSIYKLGRLQQNTQEQYRKLVISKTSISKEFKDIVENSRQIKVFGEGRVFKNFNTQILKKIKKEEFEKITQILAKDYEKYNLPIADIVADKKTSAGGGGDKAEAIEEEEDISTYPKDFTEGREQVADKYIKKKTSGDTGVVAIADSETEEIEDDNFYDIFREYIKEQSNKLSPEKQKRLKELLEDSPPQSEEDVDELIKSLGIIEEGSGRAEVRIPDSGGDVVLLDMEEGEDAVEVVNRAEAKKEKEIENYANNLVDDIFTEVETEQVVDNFIDDLFTQTVTEQEPAKINPQPVQVNTNTNPSFEAGVLNQQSNTIIADPNQKSTISREIDAGTRTGGKSLGGLGGILNNLDKGVTSEFSKRRKEGLSIAKLKDDIRSFHTIYEGIIPAFKIKEHQDRKKRALLSTNKREVLIHYEEMETMIANYYKNDSGFKLGVIISAESLFGGGSNPTKNLQALGMTNSVGGLVKDKSSFERGGTKSFQNITDVEPTFTRGGIDHALQKPVSNRIVKGSKKRIVLTKNVNTIPTQVFRPYNHILNRKLIPQTDFKIKGRKK